ncbi:hypothetical protein Q3G72_001669 [Acer saccharum]|nr:hypothetical protein Q3G72_001669 [Acer saccharum]
MIAVSGEKRADIDKGKGKVSGTSNEKTTTTLESSEDSRIGMGQAQSYAPRHLIAKEKSQPGIGESKKKMKREAQDNGLQKTQIHGPIQITGAPICKPNKEATILKTHRSGRWKRAAREGKLDDSGGKLGIKLGKRSLIEKERHTIDNAKREKRTTVGSDATIEQEKTSMGSKMAEGNGAAKEDRSAEPKSDQGKLSVTKKGSGTGERYDSCKSDLREASNSENGGRYGNSRKWETTTHALWGCPMIKNFRSGCPSFSGPKWQDDFPFCDIIRHCSITLLNSEMEILCTFFWRIWFLRNQRTHGAVWDTFEIVWEWATKFVDKFQAANSKVTGNQLREQVERPKWQCPTSGMFKINTDAALLATQMKVGFGIIIRNDSGAVMGSSIQPAVATVSPQAAEAMAIFRGITFALKTGFLPLVVESDAKGVVELINKGVPSDADFRYC